MPLSMEMPISTSSRLPPVVSHNVEPLNKAFIRVDDNVSIRSY